MSNTASNEQLQLGEAGRTPMMLAFVAAVVAAVVSVGLWLFGVEATGHFFRAYLVFISLIRYRL